MQAQVRNRDRAIPAPPVPSNNLAEPLPSRGILPLPVTGTATMGLAASNQGASTSLISSASDYSVFANNTETGHSQQPGLSSQPLMGLPSSTAVSLAGPSNLTLQPTEPMSDRDQREQIARLRVIESLKTPMLQKKPRKRRTCRRCAKPECHGSKSIEECDNPCQDCGRVRCCKGRNPARNPKTPCWDAWD